MNNGVNRSFSDFLNKKQFNFSINDKGLIVYPTLYLISNSNKIRIWNIYISLNTDEKILPIKEEYLSNEFIEIIKKQYPSLHAKYWTETGLKDGKLLIHTKKIIKSGKNIGKKNETNILTQALIVARKEYLKKIDSGYELNINSVKRKMIFPMALHSYNNNKNKIIYPCYIQPKLDGVRVLVAYDKESDSVIFYSRKLKIYSGFSYIKNELYKILKNNPMIILDGELYNHAYSLQEISGIVRNEEKSENTRIIQFHIFDCVNLSNYNMTFKERYEYLLKIIPYSINFMIVHTDLVNNEKEADELYNNYINILYEGIIYKNKDAVYPIHFNKEYRSFEYLKRKKIYDEEFKIVDYREGEGKDTGAIIFILETKNHKRFHAVPNATYEDRKTMFQNAKKDFEKYYKYKMATIRFDEWSKDDVPLRAKFIVIRDYEN